MKKTLSLVIILSVLLSFAACGSKEAEPETFIIDNVSYNLTTDWSYDEDSSCLNKGSRGLAYIIVTDPYIVGECSSVEERKAMYEPDGSDGIDLYDITINGTDALMAVEPVNEITDIYVFFYVDGVEHAINFEPDFEEDNISENTQELLDSIAF